MSVSNPSFGRFKQCRGALGNLSSFMFLCAKKRGGDICKIIYCDTSIIVNACASTPGQSCPLPDAQPYVLGVTLVEKDFWDLDILIEIPESSGAAGSGEGNSGESLVSWGLGIPKDAFGP